MKLNILEITFNKTATYFSPPSVTATAHVDSSTTSSLWLVPSLPPLLPLSLWFVPSLPPPPGRGHAACGADHPNQGPRRPPR